jgi:hypothetical protein
MKPPWFECGLGLHTVIAFRIMQISRIIFDEKVRFWETHFWPFYSIIKNLAELLC